MPDIEDVNTETVDTQDVGGSTEPAVKEQDGPGSGRSDLRRQIEKSVEESRKSAQPAQKPAKRRAPVSQAEEMRREASTDGEAEPEEVEVTEVGEAPVGWAADAKSEWANVPPAVQAAVIKREADMARGVQELKKRYEDLDQAIAPRLEAIRRHGQTPAAAVNQLFAWWEALAGNPDQAFPALMQSFNYDPRRIFGQQQQQPQQQYQQQEQVADQQPSQEQWASFINQLIEERNKPLQEKYSMLEQQLQASNQAKTNEILSTWSRDKPYFEEVRERMAYLIASGAVPALPNGAADLDRAYDEAVWGIPHVRQKVLADQQRTALEARKAKQAAELKAQQEQAEKARRLSGSLTSAAPGTPGSPGQPRAKGKSVRESIQDAIMQHRPE